MRLFLKSRDILILSIKNGLEGGQTNELFTDACRDLLKGATSALQSFKSRNAGVLRPEFDQFITSFSTPVAATTVSTVTATFSGAPAPTHRQFYNGNIDSLLRQMCEPYNPNFRTVLTADDDKNCLLRNRFGGATMGFLNNLEVLNVVQRYLTGPFTAVVLNRLLDAQYGSGNSYTQRRVMQGHHTTLYPYLRFALIGPSSQQTTALVTRGQTSADLVSAEISGVRASPDLLLAVLQGDRWGRNKVRPEPLVDALIGGKSLDVEQSGGFTATSSHVSQNDLPPLIFHFLASQEHTQILLRNILYVGPDEQYQYDYRDKGRYQPDSAKEMLRLVDYVWKNASEEQRPLAIGFLKMVEAGVRPRFR